MADDGRIVDDPPAYKELAYETWRTCGQNVSETVRRLKADHAYEISRQSIHAWIERYGWRERAAMAEAAAADMADATSDEAILNVLLAQKKKYEAYFSTLPVGQIDNQAVYGFNSILKTICELRPAKAAAVDRPRMFLENLQWIAGWLKDNDPTGLKVLAESFDAMTAAFKQERLNA